MTVRRDGKKHASRLSKREKFNREQRALASFGENTDQALGRGRICRTLPTPTLEQYENPLRTEDDHD